MAERRINRLPRTATRQIELFPSEEELSAVTNRLHNEVREVVEAGQIRILESSARTKTLERRLEKLKARGWNFPLPDVHGVRLILVATDTKPAAEGILAHWPSPKMYWWGLPSFRDYSDPAMKGRFNRAGSLAYKAIHLNIRINEGARIAEIQIMTPEQAQVAEQTREEYLKRQTGRRNKFAFV